MKYLKLKDIKVINFISKLVRVYLTVFRGKYIASDENISTSKKLKIAKPIIQINFLKSK